MCEIFRGLILYFLKELFNSDTQEINQFSNLDKYIKVSSNIHLSLKDWLALDSDWQEAFYQAVIKEVD